MTVRKTARCGGRACVVAKLKLRDANEAVNVTSIMKTPQTHKYNIIVNFNDKDQLCLSKREDDGDKNTDQQKDQNDACITIDEIVNCANVENYPNCANTLVFYVTRSGASEAIVVKFENEQDFKRIYFTYKYFKMRNRLAKQTCELHDSELFPKKSNDVRNAKGSYDDSNVLNLDKSENIHSQLWPKGLKSYFDQPLSLMGIKIVDDLRTDKTLESKDFSIKSEKKIFHKKARAPLPPSVAIRSNLNSKEKILKGEFVRVSVDKAPDIIPKENKVNKTPDILMFRETKSKRSSPPNLWIPNKGPTGYESDCEEWRNSRSQFSTAAFDSLTRPSKMALSMTMRKPRLEPQYYRPNEHFTSGNFGHNQYSVKPPPRLAKLQNDKRNLVIDHRKFQSLQSLDAARKLAENKKQNDLKRSGHTNLSNRITGLTNKLRELGSGNSIGRFKAHSHGDVSTLKPVLKSNDGNKRSVVRTCSVEPPKKVTFSAFATVQVV